MISIDKNASIVALDDVMDIQGARWLASQSAGMSADALAVLASDLAHYRQAGWTLYAAHREETYDGDTVPFVEYYGVKGVAA